MNLGSYRLCYITGGVFLNKHIERTLHRQGLIC